jgi:hypothetical protein
LCKDETTRVSKEATSGEIQGIRKAGSLKKDFFRQTRYQKKRKGNETKINYILSCIFHEYYSFRRNSY